MVRSVQTSAMFDVERTTGVLRSAFASDRYRAALVHDLPQPLDWTGLAGRASQASPGVPVSLGPDPLRGGAPL